jgi:hypothetical protein
LLDSWLIVVSVVRQKPCLWRVSAKRNLQKGFDGVFYYLMTNTGYDQKGSIEMGEEITIRRSTDADRDAINRLAELDSRQVPGGPAMLGFVGEELRAAIALDDGASVADPFQPTAELVELLRVRANQRNGRTSVALRALRPWRHATEAA